MRLSFTKMHGAGNDFVVLDATRTPFALDAAQVRRLADRRLGVGADQVLVVEPARAADADFAYRIFNGESGEEVEQCGNGARCFVRFVREHALSDKPELVVDTMNRRIVLHDADDEERVAVDMDVPAFDGAPLALELDFGGGTAQPDRVDLWLVSMGNPHAIQFVADVEAAPVARQGPAIERHPRFPAGVNAGFAQIVSRHAIRLRVHERGAGETLSCGTGACAAAACAIRIGLADSPVEVQTRGGTLTIEWPGEGHPLVMVGPAETVYEGAIEL